MSINIEPRTEHTYLKFRDDDGQQHTVTVNEKNLIKYGIPFLPGKPLSINHAEALENAIINKNIKNSCNRIRVAMGIAKAPNLSSSIKEYLDICPTKSVPRRKSALEHLLRAAGDILLRDFGRKDIDRFVKFISENKDFSSVTRHDYIDDVKTFCNWLIMTKYIEHNPATGVRVPSANPPRDYLNSEQIKELLNLIHNDEIKSLVIIGLNMGPRPSEVRNLQWCDIDFEQNRVHLRGTKTNNSDRWIPLFPSGKEYLLKMPRNNKYVLTTGSGMPLDKDNADALLKRFKSNHPDFPSWDYRKLRRTYGSILLLNEFPMATVSRFLGHSSITTTERWYVHLTTNDLFQTIPKNFHGISLKDS